MDQKKAAEAIDQAAFRHSLGDVGKQARMPRLGFEVVSDADQAKHSVLQHSHFSKAKGKSLGEIPMPKKVIQSEVDREKTKSMISSHDKHPPIKVAKINGEHVVVDGHHRLAVAKALGKTKIKAELVESEMNEDDLLEGETPEERERRLKATRERLGTKEKKSPEGIKASYFMKHFQGKLPGRKVTVGDMNKESMGEESRKGKNGMKTFKEYFEENLAAESEQLDELSKSTLASYIKKSTDDHPRHQAAADEIGRKADINKPMPEKMHKALDKVWNRKMGIHRAVDKLTRENEQLDEESCKVGDQVHVGHMVKGGAGVEGKVEKIEGNQVFVKNSEGRTFKGLLKNVSKMQTEDLDEADITTVGGRLDLRPGTKYKHEVVKSHGIHTHETGDQHRVFTVKKQNGFHGVLVTNKDKTHIVGQTVNNHSKEDALKIADHYKQHGQIGMKNTTHGTLVATKSSVKHIQMGWMRRSRVGSTQPRILRNIDKRCETQTKNTNSFV